jgi:hypothetical protein
MVRIGMAVDGVDPLAVPPADRAAPVTFGAIRTDHPKMSHVDTDIRPRLLGKDISHFDTNRKTFPDRLAAASARHRRFDTFTEQPFDVPALTTWACQTGHSLRYTNQFAVNQ